MFLPGLRGALAVLLLVAAACAKQPNGASCAAQSDCAAGLVCFANACTPGANAQQCPANRDVCDDDRVCPGGFCDKTHDSADGVAGDGLDDVHDPFGCCVILVCQADRDCNAGEICDVTRGVCLPAATCDPTAPGACAEADGGARCVWAGDAPSCEPISRLPAPDACELVSNGAVLVEGGHMPLAALGTKNGAPLAFAQFTFGVDAGALAADGTYTGCAGPAPCSVHVTATSIPPGAASCTGTETVLPAHEDGATRVVVVDLATRAPLADVFVQALFGRALVSTKTDANGVATFFANADAVSALPLDHDWHTIIAPALLGGDVVVVTRATPDAATVHGKKGTLGAGALHSSGDVRLGVVGLALPSLVDVDLASAIGSSTPTDVHIEGLAAGTIVAMPSGEMASLGTTVIKPDWVALSSPPGAPNAGSLAWGLAQEVPLESMGLLIDEIFGPGAPRPAINFLFDSVEAMSIPDHAFASVSVDDGPAPLPPADGSAIPSSQWPFHPLDLEPGTQAALARDLAWPASPPHRDAAVVALARVPGRGDVVLGAAAVEDVGKASEPKAPHVLVSFAPPHDGLEGSPVTLAAISLEHTALADQPRAVAVSAALLDASERVVPPFLPALRASFRDGALTSTNDPGAALYRVQLDGADGRWFVWSTSTPSFDAAKLTDGTLGSRADSARVESFSLSTPFSSIVAGDGFDLASVDAATTRITSEPLF